MMKSKKVHRIKWKSIPCPRGCGARWNHYIYPYKGGNVCRIYWTKGLPPFGFAPFKNKPIPSFRVHKVDGKWEKHPNPAWKDSAPLKRCC